MRKHPFDAISFIFGLIFVLLAAGISLPEEPWDLLFGGFSFGWIIPAVLILIGGALVLPAIRKSSGEDEEPLGGSL